ncbi:MAG: metal-dependent transcriptional regulator [Eubacteriales bacterium]|nr:metal-dependent transcriptional regulator [Eubacteriales bacterium]
MEHVKSSEDYLEAVLMIEERQGSCRCVDIARQLGFSKPSVTNAIQKLEASGFVRRAEDGRILLTDTGMEIAGSTLSKHRFFSTLFTRLGVAPDIAEADACAIEHSISDVTYKAMREYFEKA